MNRKAPTLRKFKGFNDDYFSSIGNYGQDYNTGGLLAFHFYNVVEETIEYPELKDNSQLKKLINRIPKGDHYKGLMIGLFGQLSTYFEPLVKGSCYGDAISQDELFIQLAECGQYQDQLQKYIRIVIKQWFINFTAAVNKPDYDGLERCLLSDLVLALPETLHLTKNCYAWFCYELTKLLSDLIKAKEAQS